MTEQDTTTDAKPVTTSDLEGLGYEIKRLLTFARSADAIVQPMLRKQRIPVADYEDLTCFEILAYQIGARENELEDLIARLQHQVAPAEEGTGSG
jgi:hypothetical protein